MGNQQGRGLQTDQPVQLINQDRPLHVTAATRDNDAKHRLVLTSDKETAQQIWILRPVKTATNMTCRILHETTGEYLYSSTPMDGLRRHVHTWVGNINGDPGAIWVLVPTTSSTNQYTIMNDKSKEYLYTSNKNCQEGTRQAFTWMHNANDDPTMIWEIKPININNNATTLDPFEAAYVLANARNDPQITSEHLLLVLIRDHPECFPSNVNLEELRQCLSTINPNFDTSTKSATTKSATTESSLTSATKTSTSMPQSPAFVRCVCIFDAITKIIENASESSLNLPCCCIGALLLSENSVARLALERSYVVDCNAQMYLAQRCGISVESVESYVAARAAAIRTGWVAAWEETILVPKSPHMAPLALPSLIQRAQDALGPTVESNWMVPGLILTGQEPRSNQELQAILNVGVDTFVCFTEWGPGKYVSVLNGLISRSSIKTSPILYVSWPIVPARPILRRCPLWGTSFCNRDTSDRVFCDSLRLNV